jgi:adenylosuccinate lyase
MALAKLRLKPDPAPAQVVSRDRHAEVLGLLAVNSGTLAKIAIDVRTQSRTEIEELREPFEAGAQQGSSSMPHKRNPELSERIVGLNRRIRSTAAEELDAMLLWDERDISHSATERFTFPDAFGGLAYSTKLTRKIIDGLVVDKARMAQNLELTHGAIYSASLMNALVAKGWNRTSAYERAKKLALIALDEKMNMRDLVLRDPQLRASLSPEKLGEIFNPQTYLRNIEVSYKRLGLIES